MPALAGSTRINTYSHYRPLAVIMVDDRLVGDAAAHLPVGLLKIECEYNTTLAPNESLMQRPTAPVDDRSGLVE